ncbi:MAG: alanine racemase [Erysipelotrichaceae bacterium]|nr:alanine racemase [Erysipelotrichaceae bacterium]MBR2533792.1 alanine racemase [Erysipelotrichaceae bacterium]
MYRSTYVEVDLDKLKYNARRFQERSKKEIIGVVKANGYCTVDYMEAKALEECGISFFAVSSLDEALRLRKHGIQGHILILGHVPEDAMDLIRKNDISIVTVSREFVQKADLEGVRIHLKLNTGMNRIGVNVSEAKKTLELLKEKNTVIEGVMSHFSSSDSDEEYSKKQYAMFKDCVLSLDYGFRYIHMSATDGAIIVDDDICNAQRIGIGLLGYSSYDIGLRPCVSLYSETVMCKQLSAGETVSYGRHYTSDGKGYILTIPLGYADGFYRSNTGKEVFVENERGIIVGSVCMDQLMILTENPHPVGTRVELFGEHIDIAKRAEDLHTITYELLTSLSDRIARVYVSDGKVTEIIDPRF